MQQENLNISQEDWQSILSRYRNKEFIIDDFNNKYIIAHNWDLVKFKKAILKFKYSKISLNELLFKMKSNDLVSKTLIKEVEEYYLDKSDVSLIPLNLTEIRDNLFDINLLIKYCVNNKIDWVFVKEDEYQRLNPVKKKFLKRKKKTIDKLLEMSSSSLKIEILFQKKEMKELIKVINKAIFKLKEQINVRAKQ
jgi:hypothetical protein